MRICSVRGIWASPVRRGHGDLRPDDPAALAEIRHQQALPAVLLEIGAFAPVFQALGVELLQFGRGQGDGRLIVVDARHAGSVGRASPPAILDMFRHRRWHRLEACATMAVQKIISKKFFIDTG